jgi:hypothetical protein
VQHWLLFTHVSLVWRQYDAESHLPFAHSLEQQLALLEHVPPDSVHPPPTFWQVPVPEAPHLPLQHCALLVHATPSSVHAVAEHAPFAPQKPEQQSAAFVQPPPIPAHGPLRLPHWFGE